MVTGPAFRSSASSGTSRVVRQLAAAIQAAANVAAQAMPARRTERAFLKSPAE